MKRHDGNCLQKGEQASQTSGWEAEASSRSRNGIGMILDEAGGVRSAVELAAPGASYEV